MTDRSEQFVAAMDRAGLRYVYGVPDSLLAGLIARIEISWPSDRHMVVPNEGTAVGMAIGSYLGTGVPAAVYLQNSGLGNAGRPLVSLADRQVYSVPMVLIIGWRGEVSPEGVAIPDEPQHRRQGEITPALLNILGIPFEVLDADSDPALAVDRCMTASVASGAPTAMLVRNGTFDRPPPRSVSAKNMSREQAIAAILGIVGAMPIVATTGMASREVFEVRRRAGSEVTDFLTVGGMGHALAIAVGLARSRPDQDIVCIDGDGATLMHMGVMAAAARTPNLLHVVINNGSHDSVGGQPTLAAQMPLRPVAAAMGYGETAQVSTPEALRTVLRQVGGGSVFVEAMCRPGSRPDLGRPTLTPLQTRSQFMADLDGSE